MNSRDPPLESGGASDVKLFVALEQQPPAQLKYCKRPEHTLHPSKFSPAFLPSQELTGSWLAINSLTHRWPREKAHRMPTNVQPFDQRSSKP